MTTRRALAFALGATGLAACAPPGPPRFGYARAGDPFYAALTTAERKMTDLARYRGQPAQAARALGQFLFILAEWNDGVAAISMPNAAMGTVQGGYGEIVSALGLAPNTPPRAASHALRRFANAFDAGQREAALQALAQPFFTRGPQATLAVLENLPPLPAVESAAYAFNQAAATMGDFGSRTL